METRCSSSTRRRGEWRNVFFPPPRRKREGAASLSLEAALLEEFRNNALESKGTFLSKSETSHAAPKHWNQKQDKREEKERIHFKMRKDGEKRKGWLHLRKRTWIQRQSITRSRAILVVEIGTRTHQEDFFRRIPHQHISHSCKQQFHRYQIESKPKRCPALSSTP